MLWRQQDFAQLWGEVREYERTIKERQPRQNKTTTRQDKTRPQDKTTTTQDKTSQDNPKTTTRQDKTRQDNIR